MFLAEASITESSIDFQLQNPSKGPSCLFPNFGEQAIFGQCYVGGIFYKIAELVLKYRLFRPMSRISAGLLVNQLEGDCLEVASDGAVSFKTCDRFNWRQYFYINSTSGRIISYDDPTKCLDDGGWTSANYIPKPSFQQCNDTDSNQYWAATVTGKDVRDVLSKAWVRSSSVAHATPFGSEVSFALRARNAPWATPVVGQTTSLRTQLGIPLERPSLAFQYPHASFSLVACAAAGTATPGAIVQPELFLLQTPTEVSVQGYCLTAQITTSACSAATMNCGVVLTPCPNKPEVTVIGGVPLSDAFSPVFEFVRPQGGGAGGRLREVAYQNCLTASGTSNSLFLAPCDPNDENQVFVYEWESKLVRSEVSPNVCVGYTNTGSSPPGSTTDCSSSGVLSFDLLFYRKYVFFSILYK